MPGSSDALARRVHPVARIPGISARRDDRAGACVCRRHAANSDGAAIQRSSSATRGDRCLPGGRRHRSERCAPAAVALCGGQRSSGETRDPRRSRSGGAGVLRNGAGRLAGGAGTVGDGRTQTVPRDGPVPDRHLRQTLRRAARWHARHALLHHGIGGHRRRIAARRTASRGPRHADPHAQSDGVSQSAAGTSRQ